MIKQLRLINCQSWEDQIINLSTDKLNVIAARNNTGKSVIYKMLKVLGCPKYYSKNDLKDLIRWGAEKADMLLLFDDGSIGSVSVYPNRVAYGYKNAGSDYFLTSDIPFTEVLMKAGIVSDVDGQFVANIIDTDQDMLLVNSDLKSNYDLMKLLVFNEDLNAIRDRSEALLLQFRDTQIQLEVKTQKLQSMISDIEYVDIASLEFALDRQRCVCNFMYQFIDAYRKLERILTIQADKTNYDELLRGCAILARLEEAQPEDLVVQEFQFDESALSLLEALEKNGVQNLCVPDKPISSTYVDLLSAVESVNPDDLLISAKPEKIEFVDILENFEDALTNLCDIGTYLMRANEAKKEAEYLFDLFSNSGIKYACPIYKEVIFDGEKCLPYS